VSSRGLDVRMPAARPLPERHPLLSTRPPRELRLLVRPRDGAVVLVLRGEDAAWEMSADAWRGLVERVTQAQADPRRAGAAILLGVERSATAGTLAALAAAVSELAEQE